MPILWAGGEDLSFQNGQTPGVTTTGGAFRSAYSRCALSVGSGSEIKGQQFSAVTSAWLTFWMAFQFGDITGSIRIGGFGQFSSQKSLSVGTSSGGGTKLNLYTYDGTTLTSIAAESGNSITGGLQRVDMQVISYGASATVNVYLDGALVIPFTGDVTVSGMTNFDCTVFGPNRGTALFISEVIVANEDSRAFCLMTMAPTGAGSTDLWTGVYTDCDPVTINDSNAVFVNTASQDEQFTLSALASGIFSIKACIIAARATATAGSIVNTLKLGWNTNSSVNVDSGHALTGAWACYERLATVNPVTTNPWVQSEMAALQVDLQSET